MQIKKNQVKKNHHVGEEASEEAQNWFVHKNLKSKKSAIQVRSGVYPERWPWIFHGDHEFWIIYSFTFIQSARTLFQMANYSSAESVIRKCCGLLMNRNNCAFSRHQMFPCCYSERLIGLYRSTAIHKIQQTNLCQRIVFVRVRLSYVKKKHLITFLFLDTAQRYKLNYVYRHNLHESIFSKGRILHRLRRLFAVKMATESEREEETNFFFLSLRGCLKSG